MKRLTLYLIMVLTSISTTSAQFTAKTFGDGIRVAAADSTFTLKLGFRFQNLATAEWDYPSNENVTDFSTMFLVRRSRLKFDGWAFSKSLIYKLELGLSNRDLGGATGPEFNRGSNVILDAFLKWNFYKGFYIQFGQGKLPGNRERVISSGDLQLVDRSRVNSRFTIDRDIGLQLIHEHKLFNNFFMTEKFAFSQGEGRDVTGGSFGGHEYTFRVEMLPLGKFMKKEDYRGSDLKRHPKPKLSVGFTYDINNNAVRERANLGSFIRDENGTYLGKNLTTIFADFMFKYQGFSMMGEFADKKTDDDDPQVFSEANNLVGTFYTGSGLSIQAGYLLQNNIEFVGRYVTMNPDDNVAVDNKRYTFGINKFFVGHKLKIQTDFTRIERVSGDDSFVWRTQMDIHF